MNPEFRRQLWLQFSPARLIVLPLLVVACFAAVVASGPRQPASALAYTGAILFGLLVWGMGTLAAGASVMDEITERTWDQQRMSAMQPWAMTWGKLAGATAYGWYGGAWCLLVAVPSALISEPAALVLRWSVGGILGGVLLQSMLIAVNLQLARVGGRMARTGGVTALLLTLLWAVGPLLGLLEGEEVLWWSRGFERTSFALASLALFAACALIAAWRVMAEVLAVRQFPWGWPALALIATVYLTGFAPEHRLATLGMTGLVICALATYFALLTEPQPRPLWQRVATRLTSGQWRAALQQLPRWPTTLALALPFAGVVVFALPQETVLPGTLGDYYGLHALSVVMLMVRDCALALFLAFSPTGRRPALAFWVLMGVLYGLLPWLLNGFHNELLLGLAEPLLTASSWSVAFAALHMLVALVLLRWRWRATAT